jgi:hypothetical protein
MLKAVLERRGSSATRYVGFGAADEFGAHAFNVIIPLSAKGDVTVIEDYGLKGGENGLPPRETRIVLPRRFWAAVAETARKDFAARLKAKNLSVSRWTTGDNKVDRMLGKELCVLLWAVEHATSVDECKAVAARWAAFRPEERWWLFSQTVAEAGLAEDANQGWRKALYYAMSGDSARDTRAKRVRPDDNEINLPLFG